MTVDQRDKEALAAVLPCPFCGTRMDDPHYEASDVGGFRAFQVECGKCEARWPVLKESDVAHMKGPLRDEDAVRLMTEHLNQRAEGPKA